METVPFWSSRQSFFQWPSFLQFFTHWFLASGTLLDLGGSESCLTLGFFFFLRAGKTFAILLFKSRGSTQLLKTFWAISANSESVLPSNPSSLWSFFPNIWGWLGNKYDIQGMSILRCLRINMYIYIYDMPLEGTSRTQMKLHQVPDSPWNLRQISWL